MAQYSFHPQVKIHYASDKSGILLFIGFTGSTLQLAWTLEPLIRALSDHTCLTQDKVDQYLKTLQNERATEVWHTLLSSFVVVEDGQDETQRTESGQR